MSDGQDRSYMKTTIVKLRKIDTVGDEGNPDTATHTVYAGGDEFLMDKEAGAEVAVGDYLITYVNIGWATETSAKTHLPAADFVSEGWRYVRGGRN